MNIGKRERYYKEGTEPVKNKGICPKCHSKKIVMVEGKVGPYWNGNNIAMGPNPKAAVLVDRYICCHCGYSEEWIEQRDGIEKIYEKFHKQ